MIKDEHPALTHWHLMDVNQCIFLNSIQVRNIISSYVDVIARRVSLSSCSDYVVCDGDCKSQWGNISDT